MIFPGRQPRIFSLSIFRAEFSEILISGTSNAGSIHPSAFRGSMHRPLAIYTGCPYTELVKIFATASYERNAKRLLKPGELAAMEKAIAAIRKASGDARDGRYPQGALGNRRQRQKRRRASHLLHLVVGDETHFLFIYAKNTQADLTGDQRKKFRNYVEALCKRK
jgi:hypothetical protein